MLSQQDPGWVARRRREMVRQAAISAAVAGGLGFFAALVASAHGWPVPARLAICLVMAAIGIALPYVATVTYVDGVEANDRQAVLRLDEPATSRLYRPSGLAVLVAVQGFSAALGIAGWRPAWAGWAASCVAVLVWGLAGMGLVPLPGRARRVSRSPWVQKIRMRVRSRSHQLVVRAVVWWPGRVSYRSIVRVTCVDCETADQPPGDPPRVEIAAELVWRPSFSWKRQCLRERMDLDAFPGCQSLTVLVTTDPTPGREGTAHVQLQRRRTSAAAAA